MCFFDPFLKEIQKTCCAKAESGASRADGNLWQETLENKAMPTVRFKSAEIRDRKIMSRF